ncbi:DUF6765 family protein [Thermodesulfobacteriota bacterium]
MHLDFHFYAIYVLCRCNGMSPENSKKVAYASQYTDDATYGHEIEFENGGRFQQAISAHIVLRENMDIAQDMVREVAGLRNKPYILHRLGIVLHLYADTWSHRDSSGMGSELNEVFVCRKIYVEISRFLSKNSHPEYRTENVLKWRDIEKNFDDLFKKKANFSKRCERLKDNINRSAFGFTCQSAERDLSYDDGEWFKDAVKVRINREGRRTYTKKDHFHISDWKYFHDAAASHRSFVLNELFRPGF